MAKTKAKLTEEEKAAAREERVKDVAEEYKDDLIASRDLALQMFGAPTNADVSGVMKRVYTYEDADQRLEWLLVAAGVAAKLFGSVQSAVVFDIYDDLLEAADNN